MGKNIVHWWPYLISTKLTMCGVRADVVTISKSENSDEVTCKKCLKSMSKH